jgi:alpha-tubulin suppressor-like RCC1 family protein
MDSQKAGFWSWGYNGYGQLGDGTTANIAFPKHVFETDGIYFKSVAAGAHYSLAVTEDGRVFAWGYNTYGQLGDGTTTDKHSPTLVVVGLEGSKVKSVSAGGYYGHSLAVTEDGEVFAWGYNGYGQLGDGTTTNNDSPVQILDFKSLKLRIIAVAAGENHSMALTSDGQVWVWGINNYNQLGDGTTTNYQRPVVVRGLEEVMAIAAGRNHCLALLNNGKVFGWGNNSTNQITETGYGATVKTPKEIEMLDGKNICAIFSSCQADHNFALSSSGTVWSWGDNNYGQASDHDIAPGTPVSSPNKVEGLEGIGFAAAGEGHSLVTSMKRGATVQVLNAKTEWMPMEMRVETGETLIIEATGRWKVDSEPDTCWVTADGFADTPWSGTALEKANLGSLIGRIDLQEPFFVGSHYEEECQKSGWLYLQMNDCPGAGMADNEGELEIRIQKVNR